MKQWNLARRAGGILKIQLNPFNILSRGMSRRIDHQRKSTLNETYESQQSTFINK